VVKCTVRTYGNTRGKDANDMNIIFHELPSFLTRNLLVKAICLTELEFRKGIRSIGVLSSICSDHIFEIVTPQ
jgi:hypothetical protein